MRRQTAPSIPPGDLLTPEQVRERLGVSESTLVDWRFRHRGPAYVKVGRLVRYPSAMLDAWLAERLRRGGADGGQRPAA